METQKRAKTAEAPRDEDRLKKLLAYIGDFGLESLGPHTTKLVSTVASLYEQHQAFILHIFSECVCCLPHKAQIYAQVHGSLCAQIADFHTSACAAVAKKLADAAQSGDIVRGKGAVRFIAYLARLKLASPSGFILLLNQLISSSSNPDSCSYYGLLALIGLSIAGEVLDEGTIARALAGLEEAKRSRNTSWKVVGGTVKTTYDDHFDRGLACVMTMAGNGWKSEVLPSYTLDTTQQLEIPGVSLPTAEAKYVPRIHVPFPIDSPLSETDRWYSEDLITDLIYSFHDSTDQMAEILLKFCEGTSSVALLGYTIAEEVTNKASILPQIVFSTTAIRVIPGSPEVMKSLEGSFAYYLKYAELMDLETIERLSRFYSHIISNFSSVWSWTTLVPEDLPDTGLFFLKTLIADLARLIELDRLTSTLPERLHTYFPPPQEPILRYADIEESVENTDCQLIIDRIQSKATGQMMKTLLTSKEICNSGDFLLQIFSECLFFHGAKSLLHVTTYLERYSDLMHTVKPEIVMEALTEVWKKSSQKVLIICKRLLSMGLLRPEDVLSFATHRIESGDKSLDWNKCDWSLLEHSLKLLPPDKPPMQVLLTWASTALTKCEEPHRSKVKARLMQLMLANRGALGSDMTVPGELSQVVCGLRAMPAGVY